MIWLYCSYAIWVALFSIGLWLGWGGGNNWSVLLWLGLAAIAILAGYGGGTFARELLAAWRGYNG